LFGYEKGAFTGACAPSRDCCNPPTPAPSSSTKSENSARNASQDVAISPGEGSSSVGSNQKVKVDVRIMAATNRDLEVEYKKGTFRRIFISA